MAVFESKYKELGFYCCDNLRTFKNGRYVTNDEKEIAVLEKMTDVTRIDEPKQAPKAEETPEPKQAVRKKPTSAK